MLIILLRTHAEIFRKMQLNIIQSIFVFQLLLLDFCIKIVRISLLAFNHLLHSKHEVLFGCAFRRIDFVFADIWTRALSS